MISILERQLWAVDRRERRGDVRQRVPGPINQTHCREGGIVLEAQTDVVKMPFRPAMRASESGVFEYSKRRGKYGQYGRILAVLDGDAGYSRCSEGNVKSMPFFGVAR